MIITRSPLRISLGGGGTDLPSYARNYGGFVLSMALRLHVYVALQRTLEPGILLKYAATERVLRPDQIKHPIIRESFLETGLDGPDLEMTTSANAPAGTGLGSSGSFTTALLKAIHRLQGRDIQAGALAALACHIEIGRLGEAIGKQDQHIAAYGGITGFGFGEDGRVEVEKLHLPAATIGALERNTLLFFTGWTRAASAILGDQDTKTSAGDAQTIENLHRVKALGFATRRAFLSGDLAAWGEIMQEQWQAKKDRSPMASNPQIDRWYELGLENGAIGGKVVGAGGGGCLLFYTETPDRLRAALLGAGLKELPIAVDFDGTSILCG